MTSLTKIFKQDATLCGSETFSIMMIVTEKVARKICPWDPVQSGLRYYRSVLNANACALLNSLGHNNGMLSFSHALNLQLGTVVLIKIFGNTLPRLTIITLCQNFEFPQK